MRMFWRAYLRVQLTFSSLNHKVPYWLSNFYQSKLYLGSQRIWKVQPMRELFQLLFFPQCKPVREIKRDQELTIWSQPRRNPGYWWWILKVLYRVVYKFVKHGPVDIMGSSFLGVRGHVLSIVGSLAVAVDSIHLTFVEPPNCDNWSTEYSVPLVETSWSSRVKKTKTKTKTESIY